MHIFTITMDGQSGPIINGITEAVWVERYRTGGEFKLVIDDASILEYLPIDSLITHDETLEVMVVENWEIDEDHGSPTKITVSGRSLDQYILENRRVTYREIGAGEPGGVYPFEGVEVALPGMPWSDNDVVCDATMATNIIEAYTIDGIDSDLEIVDGLEIVQEYHEAAEDAKDWVFNNLPTVYEAVQQLLEVDDVGIRTRRAIPPDNLTTQFIIYKGRDVELVDNPRVLSWVRGDIEKGKYLWSSRTDINSLFIYDDNKVMKYFPDFGDDSGLTTRVGKLDVSDLELDWGGTPFAAEYFGNNRNIMRRKGKAFIKKNGKTKLVDVNVSENTSLVYNEDYIMGDLILVLGNYDASAIMRVIEHTRTFNKDGETNYPTLSKPIE